MKHSEEAFCLYELHTLKDVYWATKRKVEVDQLLPTRLEQACPTCGPKAIWGTGQLSNAALQDRKLLTLLCVFIYVNYIIYLYVAEDHSSSLCAAQANQKIGYACTCSNPEFHYKVNICDSETYLNLWHYNHEYLFLGIIKAYETNPLYISNIPSSSLQSGLIAKLSLKNISCFTACLNTKSSIFLINYNLFFIR